MFYSEKIARQVQMWTIRIGSLWLSAEFIFMERVSLSVCLAEDVFKWHDDNGVLRYSNWEDGGSDDTDLPLLDTCVVLHSITGKWENVSCTDDPENGVVCKTSKFSISGLRQLYLFSVLLCAVFVLHFHSNYYKVWVFFVCIVSYYFFTFTLFPF